MRREKDPAQCRNLRHIEKDIDRLRHEIRITTRQLRNTEANMRADIAAASSQLFQLEALKSGLGVVGRVIKPAGTGSAGISVQISVLKQKLEQLNSSLDRVSRDIEYSKTEDIRLIRARDKNASKIRDLDCVTN